MDIYCNKLFSIAISFGHKIHLFLPIVYVKDTEQTMLVASNAAYRLGVMSALPLSITLHIGFAQPCHAVQITAWSCVVW